MSYAKSKARATALGALIAASVAVTAQSAPRILVDRVVAVIENEIITYRELTEKAEPFMADVEQIDDPKKRSAERQKVLAKVLDIQIGERIVEKEIEKSRDRLGVSDRDVDAAIADVQRLNNLNREQLQAALYAQGMTWSEYRKKLTEQIERARLIQFKMQGQVQILPDEVKRACVARQSEGATADKICASHILLKTENVTADEELAKLKAKASKMQAELSSGADFSSYALEQSDDKSSPDGSLGCFGKGEMYEAFEEAAYSTPIGKVSPVVQTPLGFHILKVTQRKAASTPCQTEEELAPFQNELYQQKLERQMAKWIDGLRKQSFVEIRL